MKDKEKRSHKAHKTQSDANHVTTHHKVEDLRLRSNDTHQHHQHKNSYSK